MLIEKGEGYDLDFKESFSGSLSKEICAFANAKGGTILLGVTDVGEIRGIRDTNRLRSQIFDLAHNFDPPAEISIEVVDTVIVITIPEGTDKPYSSNGKFFLRTGPNSQQLSRNEIRDFFQTEGKILFDEKVNQDFNADVDIDEAAFTSFLKLTNIEPIMERRDILANLSIMEKGNMKNAGVLIFSKNIMRFLPSSTVTCVLYNGRNKFKILDRKEFSSDLYSNYRDTMNYLRTHLDTEYIIKGGPREEKLEIPEDVLRELIVNAMAHRDYASNACVMVSIFSDRVEITNPGGLVKGISVEDLGARSLPRNRLLFGLMHRMGLVEKIGSGILRIRQSLKEHNLDDVTFEINEHWFSTSVMRQAIRKDEATTKTTSKTTSKTGKVFSTIQEDPYITNVQISEKLAITKDGVKYHIKKLKKAGMIKRIGGRKGGHWEIVPDDIDEENTC